MSDFQNIPTLSGATNGSPLYGISTVKHPEDLPRVKDGERIAEDGGFAPWGRPE